MKKTHLVAGLVLALGAPLAGCSSGPPADCDQYVTPGADDQTAIAMMLVTATDGQTLCLGPGTYRLTDPLEIRDRTGVTIRGTGSSPGAVVLDFAMQAAGSKGLSGTAMTDFTIENLTVLDASGDNVYVNGSDGVVIRDVVSRWVTRPMESRGKYAIYPVESTDVLLERVEAEGSSDAGIYVGQVDGCIVRDSYAHGNVAGIEIENSTNCEVVDNRAIGNTGGILVFELPGLPMAGSRTSVHGNTVTMNNTPNFGEAGTIISFLPQGTGIMVLAANIVDIYDNDISGNQTVGVFMLSYATVEAVGGPMSMDPDYEPFLENVYVHGNTWGMNGTMPEGMLASFGTGNDILFDGVLPMGGMPTTLCIDEDGVVFRNIDVPGNFMNMSMDLAPHECTGMSLDPVML